MNESSLSEKLIFDVYQQVISQYQNKSHECSLLSHYLAENYGALKTVSPVELLHGYNVLSENSIEEPLQVKLNKAFGVSHGNRFYYAISKSV